MTKTFEDILREISNVDQPLAAEAIYRLSDLDPENVKTLQTYWGKIPSERRLTLIQRISEAAETNFDMEFTGLTRVALTDLDDEVREAAIEATWMDETPDMATRLIAMASGDIADNVRAAAVSALGHFILQGELGKFDSQIARRAENIAIKLYQDEGEDINVRRRALEAISNCSREGVQEMIEEAYAGSDEKMRTSALFAMGRTCDTKWTNVILRELKNGDAEMRFEAARSAGELELREAIPLLGNILGEDDRELVEMAVWSLGEIGGKESRRLLEDLIEFADEQEDEGLKEAVEEALQIASLVGEDIEF
jgi:HEAT repeat protein